MARQDATDTQELFQRLQALEQALHAQAAQRSALQGQLSETENAQGEIAQSAEAYRIIGNIMVKTGVAKLADGLTKRKETLQARIGSLERQEKRLREEMQQYQERILKGEQDGKVR